MKEERPLPLRVGVLLALDERPLGQVWGLHDSGLVLTDRRLLAWRVNGVSPAVGLADVDRIVYERGGRDVLLIVPRAAAHTPLVLLIEIADRPAAERLVGLISGAVVANARARRAAVSAEAGEYGGISTVRFRRDG